jgi:DNA-binding response OmpR family regulator
MNTTATILVAEEDPGCRAFLATQLAADGYRVLVAEDRAKAAALLVRAPDLIVVDVNGQTLSLIDAVRSSDGLAGRADPDTPMIVLSRNPDRLHRVRVLDRGGDDIVAKPYAYTELRARIAALLRRSRARSAPAVLRSGALRIDTHSRAVHIGETPLALTGREYDLLRTLAAEPGRVFSRAELLEEVWGHRPDARTRTLDSHTVRLRRKLSSAGAGHQLVTVWGVGLRLDSGAPR